MDIIFIVIKLVYYLLPLCFSVPCMFYSLFLRKRLIKKMGGETYIRRLELWNSVLQVVFIVEAFLTIGFIVREGLGEGIVGFFHLGLLFVIRAMNFAYIEGKNRGIIKD